MCHSKNSWSRYKQNFAWLRRPNRAVVSVAPNFLNRTRLLHYVYIKVIVQKYFVICPLTLSI